ncbi:TAFII55 protein conserved region-domain-containing protein [Syncephalis pseudoplumigaleata]|uniref:TAFII55 protein conserved region-domain-containing protein n=1 Tax=Syncephalis pseudoplumigaleata TaxID=1712513 RepID=A0A4P9Z5S9_9FUNG|nr:TAFII55 protein conserved region-domain-containing protein [Syncephalis pseudoplumigaleata]|eukprot:RKP27442.1 TAFII55 protein conserved region-domain-containing protein [Syncephalis pseudoplumigaleata]
MDTNTPSTPGGVRLKIKPTKEPVVVVGGGGAAASPPGSGRGTSRAPPPLTPRIRIKPIGKDTSDNLPHDLENLVRSEEQFILRLPAGPVVERLRQDIRERTIGDQVSFKFTDPRHAQLDLYGEKYRAKLVDLPCIVEAQKTFNRRHFFKVGDICQMLVVEGDQPEVQPSRPLTGNAWPDGLSAPLRDVRKRRFRKRVSKQRVEIIERQVEELLKKDAAAEQVIYEVHEMRDHATPSESDMGNHTPLAGYGHGDHRDRQSAGSDIDLEGYDSDLAAEIGRGLEQLEEGVDAMHEEDEDEDRESSESGSGSGSGEEDEDEDEEEEEGEEGGPVDETSVQRRILQEEVSELEASLQKKQTEIANAANPIVKKRLQSMADKLEAELALKKGLLKEVRDRQ